MVTIATHYQVLPSLCLPRGRGGALPIALRRYPSYGSVACLRLPTRCGYGDAPLLLSVRGWACFTGSSAFATCTALAHDMDVTLANAWTRFAWISSRDGPSADAGSLDLWFLPFNTLVCCVLRGGRWWAG